VWSQLIHLVGVTRFIAKQHAQVDCHRSITGASSRTRRPWMPVSECIVSHYRFVRCCVKEPVRDNYNLKSHRYVCITTYEPDTKSNPDPNPYPYPTTKQHAIVNIQLSIVAWPTYPDKFIRDMLFSPSVRLKVVIVTPPQRTS